MCRNCGQALADTSIGTRMCPTGRHPMDPSWMDCPYCKNAGGSTVKLPGVQDSLEAMGRRRTVAEDGTGVPPGPAPVEPPTKGRRGATKFMSDDVIPSGKTIPEPSREIVAILATYSWKPEGQVFPIFEGRNYLGSGSDCEVSITSDPQMSNQHSTIVYRGGTFLLDDASSMNGTFLGDQDVVDKVRLGNYDRIRTGATQWVFIMIRPEAGEKGLS